MQLSVAPGTKTIGWQKFARVIDSIGSDRFADDLLELLRLQTSFDSALVIYYGRRQRPVILADRLLNPARTNGSAHYVAGAYMLDPFYLKSRHVETCCLLRMRDIAPADFEASDYFSQYYQGAQVVDELNLFVPIEAGRVFAVCIERAHPSPSFSELDLSGLNFCIDAIAALARKHMTASGLIGQHDERDSEYERLETTLHRFGATVLTPREREVVQLILSGHSAPEVAALLGVSLDTAKVHRRNIYGKLGVSSLAELFSLVLHTIMTPNNLDRLAGQDAV